MLLDPDPSAVLCDAPAVKQPDTVDAAAPDTPAYLSTLNPEQRAAVTHEPAAPLLIIAGAGSGKTNTLAHRVAHLVLGGADPRRILLLTFSRRAADRKSVV